ncbi:MAG: hypothetical protein MJZ03_04560 [archaeon]|nr:hypothetical protein [archaeon]
MKINERTRMIVTLGLTIVFGFLAVTHSITSEQYIPIYTMIITFYFTSSSKEVIKNDDKTE